MFVQVLITGNFDILDLDECQNSTHGCPQQCVNTRGSFKCECFTGYRKDSQGKCHGMFMIPVSYHKSLCYFMALDNDRVCPFKQILMNVLRIPMTVIKGVQTL